MTRPYTKGPGTWTAARRAAQAERMRKMNADQDIGGQRLAALRASSKNLGKVIALGRSRRGQKLSNLQYGFTVLHLILMNRDPIIRARASETKRLGPVPAGFKSRYRALRARVGANVAMGIVRREAAMARVNR